MRFLHILIATALASAMPAAHGASAPESIEITQGATKLRAMLFRPDGPGPFAAVVALHGCGGLGGRSGAIQNRYRDWAQRLAAAGFAVVFPDSYGSRGLANLCGARASALRSDREIVADANAARHWLQQQSWVMADRISLLGWSEGGVAALWAVRPQARVDDKAPDFRSAVTFYPGCRRLNNIAWAARVPTLLLIGSADDWSSPALCRQMVAGTRNRSAAVTIHVYPGALHDFDHPNRPMQTRTGYAFSVDGTGRVHTGTHPAARTDALKRVPAWLSR